MLLIIVEVRILKNLYIIGAGGYAKSVIDSLNLYQYHIKGFIDEFKTGTHIGYPIVSDTIEAIDDYKDNVFFIAIGDNYHRMKWYIELKKRECVLINIVDKTAIVSNQAQIGEGCFIGKMAIVNSMVTTGNNCIINTKSLIEHGSRIGDHVNISTNTVLNGDVQVKDMAFIGSSSVVNGQISIGFNSLIGSGSVVVKSVEDNVVVVGVPAKLLKRRDISGL